MRQIDPSSFEPARSPPRRGYLEDEGEDHLHHRRGRRCARCGRRLGVGWTVPGAGLLLCRDCVRATSTSWTTRRVGRERGKGPRSPSEKGEVGGED
ncbi:hypothetical protein P0O15_12090 [Methanotrichaceae archaeon Mx]|uniref:GATA-type domain-containing protein n=1 Tax=Candidatus Methanocrinis natronophilus TaxID=3033396 RepID=A0ABT5XBI4_9EURY|nr:hypothetical protein [Candidatus Methanocrinis natronophilus]